jgi:hypothetical protein
LNAPGTGSALSPWSVVATLARKARSVDSINELCFSIVNDSFALLPYRSALLLATSGSRVRLVYASGLSSVDRKSAYSSWVEQVVRELLPQLGERNRFTLDDLPAHLKESWLEYWPQTVHLHRLGAHDDRVTGVVVYLPDVEWPPVADSMLATLHHVQGAALENLRTRHRGWRGLLRRSDGRISTGVKVFSLLALVAVAAMFIPIRQFVIAPAEIISLDSIAVTSPVEGIIASLAIRPNEAVKRGDVLVRLDDTALRNRLESARQALEVARAEFLAGAHRSMLAGERGTEVGVLRGRIQERLAEVTFLQEQLALLELRAPRDGIAVYGQVNDLIGKPVSPGQKVMELADPSRIGAQVWVPVADAINLKEGERFNLMLYADPLTPRAATIEQASYQAVKSPDGVAAYRVRATLEAQEASRLGLRGNAKIDGDPVALGYFVFRRPILVLRQWMGV